MKSKGALILTVFVACLAASFSFTSSKDEVAVFGPKKFERGRGKPKTITENFALPSGATAPFVMSVVNGDRNYRGHDRDDRDRRDRREFGRENREKHQVTSATIELNGVVVVSAQDFRRHRGEIVKRVQMKEQNTLKVTVDGKTGSYITVSISAHQGSTDVTPPQLVLSGPADGTITSASSVTISGTVTDTSAVTLEINGTIVAVTNGSFSSAVSLTEGTNTIEIVATDAFGNETTKTLAIIRDSIPPDLAVITPEEGFITKDTSVTVFGTVTESTATTITVNGKAVPVDPDTFVTSIHLDEGTNLITITAVDAANNQATITRHVVRDTQPPVLTLDSPQDSLITNHNLAQVSGTIADSTSVTVDVNGMPVPLVNGLFTTSVPIFEGFNTITITVTDAAGNKSVFTRFARLYTIPPVITIHSPAHASSTYDSSVAVSGTISDSVGVTLTANAILCMVGADGSFYVNVPLDDGMNIIQLTAVDAAGNKTSNQLSITRIPLPPDPARVAPKIDPTVVTTVGTATRFLYTGTDPIQTGVDTMMMSYVRAAVIRGRVLSRDNQPLPGVAVSILNHPEFGQTFSRLDGMYDMAINGGGQLTVNLSKDGYLTAQRNVNTPWQSYASVEDVVLVQLDPNVTVVKLDGDSTSVARGSIVTDEDGTRQATLMFKPGTQATMKIVHYAYQPTASCGLTVFTKVPTDTVTVLMDSLSVRATEYTVGENGPKAMPAILPPTSAYTYCVDLSTDEAQQAGALSVDFSKPVAFYLDNFLNFPVGTAVPVGYYDKLRSQWVAVRDGIVLKILDTAGGIASIDLNGDGVAESASTLDSSGVDSVELKKLASLYYEGKTLWRVNTAHFSIVDCNDGVAPDGDATGSTQNVDDANDNTQPDSPSDCGSIIGILDQSLGQRLSITGTPFTLNYNSKSARGFKSSYLLNLPLTGDTLPRGLQTVDVKVSVAGREIENHFAPSPNLKQLFIWDGKDAYGRSVQGEHPAKVSIGYTYPAKYVKPGTLLNVNFGQLMGDSHAITDSSRQHSTLWSYWQGTVGSWRADSIALGGWTLDVHKVFDMIGGKLLSGNGTDRDERNLGRNVDDVEGTLGSGDTWMAIAPDGVIYFSKSYTNQVWKKCIDGSIVLVAGTGEDGYSGDGGPATQAAMSEPTGIALGPDASVYIADSWNACIRRVDPLGVITTYAGTGTAGFSGDGGPAVDASLNFPFGIAMGSDGTLFIADLDNNRIRMVNPAGIISTVAGTGVAGFSGDGGSSFEAQLDNPTGVDVDNQGNVYIADFRNSRVRRVTPQGIITTFAGGSSSYWTDKGDGRPAASAALFYPLSVTVARDGSVYIDESGDVRRVGSDGIISTFLDRNSTYGGSCVASAIGPDGTFYCSESGPCCSSLFPENKSPLFASVRPWTDCDGCGVSLVHEVRPAFPGVSESECSVASEDGTELYIFNLNGKHLRTVDPLTGALKYSFAYDSLGLLSSIRDRNNLITTIQRDGNGNPTAIVSPYGQRTLLMVDAAGYLASVIDPAGDTTRFTYTPDGLMTSLTDARGNSHVFSYDSVGRLNYDRDPAGGFKLLTRADTVGSYSVTVLTALGDRNIYKASVLPGGGSSVTNVDPSGLATSTSYTNDQASTTIAPDGTVTHTILGSDPRFGKQYPTILEKTVTTPSGMQSTIEEHREVSEMSGLQISQFTDATTINGYRTYQTIYDGQMRAIVSVTPEGRLSFAFMDSLGRVVQDSIPGIVPVNYAYDNKGRPYSVAQGTRVSYFTYDSLGRIALATDPAGYTSGFAYDLVGLVTTQILPDRKVITFTYDPNGNMISLTPPGRPEHTFEYNVNNLANRYIPPFAGDSSRATHYSYDLDKRLTITTLPDGRTLTITYDTAGCGCGGTASRIHSLAFDRGTQVFQYDTAGRLSLNVTPEGDSLLNLYDGFIPTATYTSGSVNGSVFQYIDPDLWLRGIILDYDQSSSLGNIIGYDYDGDGLLKGIYQPIDDWWDSDQGHYMSIGRDIQTGKITGTSLGNVSTEQSYSAYGELSNYEADYNDAPMFETTYGRDSLGRITSVYETTAGVSKEMDYSYDAEGRLEKVWRNDTLISQYVYDPNGNRLAHITPAGVDSGTYDAHDRMLSYAGARYFYTANGDLREKISGTDTTRYTYDAFGNLMKVEMPSGNVIEYVIDGQNRRIARKVNGRITNKWLYAGQLTPIAELDSADNVVARFSGGYLNKKDTIYQIITDHLGSPRLIINVSTGVVVQRMDYDEFGNVTYDTNPGFQPFGFAGGIYDPQTELVRFGARDYHARIGRWTTKDPIRFDGGINLFAYVSTDPLNKTDLCGLCSFSECVNSFGLLKDVADLVGFWDIGESVYNIAKDVGKEGTPYVVEKLATKTASNIEQQLAGKVAPEVLETPFIVEHPSALLKMLSGARYTATIASQIAKASLITSAVATGISAGIRGYCAIKCKCP